MAWNDWSDFDTAGLIGGALGDQLQKSGDFFRDTAIELQSQSADSAKRAERSRAAVREFGALTAAAARDLDGVDLARVDVKTRSAIQLTRAELGKAQGFLKSADENLFIGKNMSALGRNLGAVVGAAELLYKMKNPDLGAYSFGETGAGFIGGVIGASLGLLFPPLAPLSALMGLGGAFLGKYLWEKHVAPQIGWSEKDSPRFWDSVFEAIGVGQAPKGVGDRKPAEPDLPMRLALAGRHGLVAPPVTHLGSLSRRTSASGRAEYTLSDLDPDLANRMVDRRSFGIASWYQDEWLDSTVMALDSHPDGRIDRKDHVFESLAIWRDRDGNGDLAFDEFERFRQDDVILIDRSSAPTHATAGKPEHPPKQDAPDLMAIEARHRRSFTRYFDDLLGESADVPGEPRLRTLKASFEEAIKADAATGLSDLIDFARLVGPGALRLQGWDPRPMIVAHLRAGVQPAGTGAGVGSANAVTKGSDDFDFLIGGDAAETLRGGDGNDVLSGGPGNDNLFGDGGADLLTGGDGNDQIEGGDGNDELIGDRGSDTLTGGAGNDHLRGNIGDDVLIGGPGDDQLIGGSGADTYRFELGDGCDRVSDQKSRRANRLEFGPGLLLNEAWAARRGNGLHLAWRSGESVELARYFTRRRGRFDLRFADGIVIEDAALTRWAATIGWASTRLIEALVSVQMSPDALPAHTAAHRVFTTTPPMLTGSPG